jgi:fucose permease
VQLCAAPAACAAAGAAAGAAAMPPGGDGNAAQHVVARTAVCVCAFVCMGLSVGLVGPLLPFLKARTRLTPNGLSACFVARGVGGFVGSMAGGAATDRFPGHHVVLASLLGLASATALLPAARSSAGLVFLFLCFDLSIGGLQCCNALISWTHAERATAALNALNAAFGVGTLAAPLLPLALGDAHWRWSAVIVALLTLPCAALAYSVPSPRRKHGDNDDEVADSGGAASSPAPELPRRALLVTLTVAFLLCVVGAETTLGAFLVTYVEESSALPARLHGPSGRQEGDVLTTLFWVSFTAGRLLMGVLTARMPPRHILAAELALLACSITLVLAAPASRGALYTGVLGCGAGLSGCFGGAVGQAAELIPLTGRVTGLFCAGAVAGVALVQLTASQAARAGPEGIIATVAGASYAACAVMGALWLAFPSAAQKGAACAASEGELGVERDRLLGGGGGTELTETREK